MYILVLCVLVKVYAVLDLSWQHTTFPIESYIARVYTYRLALIHGHKFHNYIGTCFLYNYIAIYYGDTDMSIIIYNYVGIQHWFMNF